MTGYRSYSLINIRSGLALAALFSWLLSFPMFGRLLLDTSGERALAFGLAFIGSHAIGLILLQQLSFRAATARSTVIIASIIIAFLTVGYAFFYGHYMVDLIILLILGIASAYLVLAWVAWFITDTKPLLNLAIAMAGANVVYAFIHSPLFPQTFSFIIAAIMALAGGLSIQRGPEKALLVKPGLKQQALKMVKALVAFVIAIYFVGGIWYQTVLVQISVAADWDAAISALLYAGGIIFLAYLAVRGQPGNLALYSLSALGVGLLINLAGIRGTYITLSYYAALNFGLAAADIFFWYTLWILGRLYGGRRVFALGFAFSLMLIAFSVMISSAGWNTGSPVLHYFTGLALLFLVIPLIFRYPFQLADLPASHLEAVVGLDELLSPPEILTPQEREIYTLLMQGATNDEMADSMYISKHTVKFHTRNTLRKLGVKNRRELLSRRLKTDG